MKVSRARRTATSFAGWARNSRHLIMLASWIVSTIATHMPAQAALDQKVEMKPMAAARRMTPSAPDRRFWAYWRSSS